MAMTDVVYGDSASKDMFPLYSLSKGPPVNRAFFQELGNECKNRKYLWFYLGSSPYSPYVCDINARGVGFNEPRIPILVEEALRHMRLAKERGVPFCAYYWDDSSHLAYPNPQKDAAVGIDARLRVAYTMMNASIERLFSGMEEAGLLEDTIIMAFGDHGDEAWSHGLNRGYCHSLPPYASQVWTPFLIRYPERFPAGTTRQLASAVDIKAMAMELLFPGEPLCNEPTPFSGLNLFRERREYAFSQNLLALQREKTDPERGLCKGYAVTDGSYRLVVSSGGDDEEFKGMALYCDQTDPANSLNLLTLFRLDRKGGIRKFSPPPEAVVDDFEITFGGNRPDDLRRVFEQLKTALANFVKDKEKRAVEEHARIDRLSAEELSREYGEAMQRQLCEPWAMDEQVPRFRMLKEAWARHPYQLFPDDAFLKVAGNRVSF